MRTRSILQLVVLEIPLTCLASFGVVGPSAPANSIETQSETPSELKCVRSIKVSGLNDISALSADGRTLATEDWKGKTGSLKIWDTQTWRTKRIWSISNTGALALSPNGKTVAIALTLPMEDNDSLPYIPSQVNLWDVTSGKLLVKLPKGTFEQPDFKTIIFSPNGKLIATDNAVWDAKTGRRLWSIKHEYVWPNFAFSPDGRLLATSQDADYYGADGQVRLWNARTGKVVNALHGSGGADGPIVFSSDGKQLATSGKPPNWTPPAGDYGDSGYLSSPNRL